MQVLSLLTNGVSEHNVVPFREPLGGRKRSSSKNFKRKRRVRRLTPTLLLNVNHEPCDQIRSPFGCHSPAGTPQFQVHSSCSIRLSRCFGRSSVHFLCPPAVRRRNSAAFAQGSKTRQCVVRNWKSIPSVRVTLVNLVHCAIVPRRLPSVHCSAIERVFICDFETAATAFPNRTCGRSPPDRSS
jgi:hypothetical protein